MIYYKKRKVYMKKEEIKKIITIITITLSLLIIDIGTRLLLYKDIDFVSITHLPPIIFTTSYILIILFIYYLKPKLGKIIYIISIIIFNIYSIVQIMHFNILDRILKITDILVVDQAGGMTGYILDQIKIIYIMPIIISLTLFIITLKLTKNIKTDIKKKKKTHIAILTIILIISTRSLAITSLGNKVENDKWNFWNTEKNIYIDYNSPSRSFIISGIYEYFFRDIYTYFRDMLKEKDTNNIEEINTYINNLDYKKEENEYTNIFKDKNLIMIMMESIDSWLVTEEYRHFLQSKKLPSKSRI